MTFIDIPRVSDYHVHLRQGAMMRAVALFTASVCGRCLVMPNTVAGDGLAGPIATAEDVLTYQRMLKPCLGDCTPLLTIKLLESTTPQTIRRAGEVGVVAAKLYPRGATTNAQDGIPTDWLEARWDPSGGAYLRNPHQPFLKVLGAMEEEGMVLCIHGEMPHYPALVDYEDEPEQTSAAMALRFVRFVLDTYPRLKVVLEHITTREEVASVQRWRAERDDRLAATITPHHLWLTIEDVVGRKIHPHHFCLPVAKFDRDREALIKAATSGHPGFFLGSDSAPHLPQAKECAEGCAGVFNAPVLVESLAEIFERRDAMNHLPGFLAHHGDAFYSSSTGPSHQPDQCDLRLVRQSWTVPLECGGVRPFLAGQTLNWRLIDER